MLQSLKRPQRVNSIARFVPADDGQWSEEAVVGVQGISIRALGSASGHGVARPQISARVLGTGRIDIYCDGSGMFTWRTAHRTHRASSESGARSAPPRQSSAPSRLMPDASTSTPAAVLGWKSDFPSRSVRLSALVWGRIEYD